SVPSQDGRREGIPVVIMEAMASGLPVVASRLSGIPELVDDGITGVLIEPGDSAGIADALVTLAQQPDVRHQYGCAGRDKVVQSFDLHQNAARLVRMFGGEKA
ncbi:MAG: glycosyltransferase, partial [Chloroflexi bacterium]